MERQMGRLGKNEKLYWYHVATNELGFGGLNKVASLLRQVMVDRDRKSVDKKL